MLSLNRSGHSTRSHWQWVHGACHTVLSIAPVPAYHRDVYCNYKEVDPWWCFSQQLAVMPIKCTKKCTDNCSVYCICIQSSVMMVTIPQSMQLFMSQLIITNISTMLSHASWNMGKMPMHFTLDLLIRGPRFCVEDSSYTFSQHHLYATQDVLMAHIGGC